MHNKKKRGLLISINRFRLTIMETHQVLVKTPAAKASKLVLAISSSRCQLQLLAELPPTIQEDQDFNIPVQVACQIILKRWIRFHQLISVILSLLRILE